MADRISGQSAYQIPCGLDRSFVAGGGWSLTLDQGLHVRSASLFSLRELISGASALGIFRAHSTRYRNSGSNAGGRRVHPCRLRHGGPLQLSPGLFGGFSCARLIQPVPLHDRQNPESLSRSLTTRCGEAVPACLGSRGHVAPLRTKAFLSHHLPPRRSSR